MASTFDRDHAVYVAKLAEQAERYDEMVEEMKNVAKTVGELTADEKNLLSNGYKSVIGARRSSWRILSILEQKEESGGNEANVKRINEYRKKVEREISDTCTDILSILDEHLIPSCKPEHSIITSVFYIKMKGDYYRYLAEIKTGDDRNEAANESLKAYEAATRIAEAELPSTDPIRLGLALNHSVFCYEILYLPERACHITKKAIDEAIPGLDSLSQETYKHSSHILHLLQDNITAWSPDISEDAEGIIGKTASLMFD
ncbi:hypothetical protein ACS0TY_017614 [Phlomoides rotata]